MSIKIEVKMTVAAMYNFMLYHAYTRFSGIFGVVFGIVSGVFGFRFINGGDYQRAFLFFFFCAIFIVGNPIMLYQKSRKQVKKTPMFQKPICYELNEEGIITSQGDAKTEVAWPDILKVVSTNASLIVYVTRMRAFILPKADLGEQYAAAVQLISTHMSPEKVKIRLVN